VYSVAEMVTRGRVDDQTAARPLARYISHAGRRSPAHYVAAGAAGDALCAAVSLADRRAAGHDPDQHGARPAATADLPRPDRQHPAAKGPRAAEHPRGWAARPADHRRCTEHLAAQAERQRQRGADLRPAPRSVRAPSAAIAAFLHQYAYRR